MSALDNTDSDVEGVATEITYVAPGSFINRRFAAPGIEVNTGRYESHRVIVRNARAAHKRFTLDTNGFTLAPHRSAVKDFLDKEEVNRIYPGEIPDLIKRLTGADRVAVQGWMVRTSGDLSRFKRPEAGYNHQGGVQPPAAEAHVDYLPESADRVAQMAYEKNFPNGPGYRRFIAGSLWRTFSKPPQDCPLAVCDGHSVGADEGVRNTLFIVDKIPDEKDQFGEMPDEDTRPSAAIFRYNPNHRWWYFPNMTRDEVLFFKFHDSDRTKAWRVPHTAFHDPTYKNANPRESVEVRVVAFFDK